MMLQGLWSLLGHIFDRLLTMLGFSSALTPSLQQGTKTLRVYIKYSGRSVQVDLDPSWSVARVKDEISPLLKVNSNEIKIIFAGNELPDNFLLQSCDVGQQSYLHAVRVQIQSSSSPNANETASAITDLDASEGENVTIGRRTRTFSNGSEDFYSPASPIPASEHEHDPTSTTAEEEGTESSVKVSDFFVYCGECGDLREGKLRVRCASCLTGAFTVAHHPQSWEDVLIPSRITGSCEEQGCEGYGQFYFKCTSHVTKGEDDAAAPLPLVKRNRDQVPCLACGDLKMEVLVFPCPLSHVTCIDCFKEYSLVKLNQREFVQDEVTGYSLGCPALCQNSLIQDPHHFKLMGKYQYDRYQRFGTEECVLQMGGIFCPQPDCGMGIIPMDANCDKIACLHGCGYVFCRKCLEGWHLGSCRSEGGEAPAEDCSSGGYRSVGYFVSQDRAAVAQWGEPTRRALRLSTKPCPNCRVPTERAGGCMHMECTKCKFQWCWVCQTLWTRDCMGNHWFG